MVVHMWKLAIRRELEAIGTKLLFLWLIAEYLWAGISVSNQVFSCVFGVWVFYEKKKSPKKMSPPFFLHFTLINPQVHDTFL